MLKAVAVSPPRRDLASTGIEGLDVVLGGGLPANRLYLLEGRPGTGKTTLSLQYLLDGARRGERGLYVTLSETEEELRASAATHNWSLDDIEIHELVSELGLDPDSEQTILHPSDLELGEIIREVMRQVEELQPIRVVFDSLSELRLLSQSPLRYRRQILALKQFFATRKCTVLLLDDRTSGPSDLQLHSIAHGVLSLEQTPRPFGAERRWLRIAKLRGVKFSGGHHDFILDTGGLTVFPRLVAARHHAVFDPTPKSTGSEGMDRLLGGGLVPGTNTLLIGPSGVGKTTTAVQCMVSALDRDEKATYFLFDEGLATFLARSKELGMDLEPHVNSGGLTILQVDPAELAPGEFACRVREAVEDRGSTMVVIDSLNAYLHAMPGEQYLILQMHELLSYLNQLGVTTLLVLGQHGILGEVRADVDLSYLSDGIMLFRYFEAKGAVRTAVSVVKSRVNAHERSIRELKVTQQGVVVGEALADFEGVLTGLPTYHGTVPMLGDNLVGRGRDVTSQADRVAVLSPRGRDAEVIGKLLLKSGIDAELCLDLAEWTRAVQGLTDLAIVTEEAMSASDTIPLFEWLDKQPAWSDYPFIVLATRQIGPRSRIASSTLERLGNVILLERPINAETLKSAVASALRSRRRQYQARTHLAELEAAKDTLRAANENLEGRVLGRTREVEAARETLAFALDSAEMGTWDLDLVKDIARRSRGHDRIFGYADGIKSWGMQDLINHVASDDRKTVRHKMDLALVTGVLDLECRILNSSGATRWIAVKGRVVYDEAKTPVRMAGIVRDRTEQHATEEALRQAQKMEAIGQLTGGVAHDFNNLLTVIVGGLDMMIRRPEQTERVKRLAEAAMNAAQRGEQLTHHLLAFSRRQMLRPQTLNPNRLLLEFKPLAERAAGGAIDLHFDLDPSVDPIRADPAQFESAILNLVVNARDAMDHGAQGTRIVVRSCNARLSTADVADWGIAPGPYVLVAVTDEGTGMTPETIARIFEPFFTTKEVGKGSGLGLAQVYGFMRSAGGYAAIDSIVGSGTSIKLYFPRSLEAVDAGTGLSPVGAIPLRRASEGETILLVEDDEEVLGMAIESLEELRYSVIVAHDAREALEHLNGLARIDILFSDIVMPGGMNGAQLAHEARRVRPGLKVLLTSGYVADLDENQTVAHGELPVLNKPYRREELARTLRLVLSEN